jgi:CRP/FNR family transcriptional regulator
VFANEPYPAHAETMEPARLLVFPRRDFMALIESQPGFAGRLLAIMARRLLHFTLLVEDLSLKEVPNRLAAYLLARQDREGLVTLDMNKRQLASVLGATPETLSRVLANFAREELVLLSSSKSIRLRDPERLRILAEAGNRKSES